MRARMKSSKNIEMETLAERKKRKELSSRGKSAEKKVQEILTKWGKKVRKFDFDRLLDSKAAGTIVAAQVSDFLLFYKGRSATLEVKELKEGLRISKKAYPQHGRMCRRDRAGCKGYLLVHTVSTEQWWVVLADDMTLGSASWLLGRKLGVSFESVEFAMEFIKKQLSHQGLL